MRRQTGFLVEVPYRYRCRGLVQKNVAGLDYLLQFAGSHARQHDAVVVTQLNYRVAMSIAGGQ